LDVAEGLLELGVEIAGERVAGIIRLPGMSGDIDGPARAFRDDGGGKRALDLPGAANERFFHRSSRCLSVGKPSSSRKRGPIITSSGIWIPSTSAFTRVFDALCAGMTAMVSPRGGWPTSLRMAIAHRAPEPFGRRWHLDVADAEVGERVHQRIGDRGH